MEFFKELPSGWQGLGAAVGAIVAGMIFLRQFLSGAAASRASDAGQIEALDVYKQMVSELRASLVEVNTRADRFAQERNDAIQTLGDLRGQLKEMTRQLEDQGRELVALRRQVNELTEQLNAKKQS